MRLPEKCLALLHNPAIFEGEEVLRKIGERMGVSSSYQPTQGWSLFR